MIEEDLNIGSGDIVWRPQEGSQQVILACPVRELLNDGTRGSMKTDTLIMDFAQHVGQGYGAAWRGILFRQTYPQLAEIVVRSKKWFRQIFPEAVYNKSEHFWEWPTGETLLFRYMDDPDDYWNYHGHEYCVPYGDVLTPDKGWIDIKSMEVGDKIYSVDGLTMKLKESIVSQVYKSFYEGDLVEVNQRGFHLSCTPNHSIAKWRGRRGGKDQKNKFELIPFNKLPSQAGILRSARWEKEKSEFFEIKRRLRKIVKEGFCDCGCGRRVKKGSRFVSGHNGRLKQPMKLGMQDFMELLGWFLSEGSTGRDGASGYFSIFQNKKEGRKRIKELLKRCKFLFRERNDGYHVYSYDWHRYFKKFGKSKNRYIPVWAKSRSVEELKCLFNALVDGDGNWFTREKSGQFYSISKQLGNDFAEIAFKLGYLVNGRDSLLESGNILYTVNFKRNKVPVTYCNKHVAKRVPYKGEICCVGIEGDHSFVIKQKGSIWISGNSWIGWEELVNWPNSDCYEIMKTCCRSSTPGMPRKYRANCNPYGVGHSWVKEYFVDPAPAGTVMYDDKGRARVRIHSSIEENKILLEADPEYLGELDAIKDPNRKKAWRAGRWDITAGGAIDDIWDERTHMIPWFEIPSSWRVDRTFDWGSAKPFSVGWWAESDGTEAMVKKNGVFVRKSFPPGTLFRIGEMYGWNGEKDKGSRMISTEIARRIRDIEEKLPFVVNPGPADNTIYDVEDGRSIGDDMATIGITWTRSNKNPGSRVVGLERFREYLYASLQSPMEDPGLFVFENCIHFKRTVPVLPRDPKKMDDVDTRAEDHIYDETRYRLLKADYELGEATVVGI